MSFGVFNSSVTPTPQRRVGVATAQFPFAAAAAALRSTLCVLAIGIGRSSEPLAAIFLVSGLSETLAFATVTLAGEFCTWWWCWCSSPPPSLTKKVGTPVGGAHRRVGGSSLPLVSDAVVVGASV